MSVVVGGGFTTTAQPKTKRFRLFAAFLLLLLLFTRSGVSAQSDSNTPGVPQEGQSAVTETLDQLKSYRRVKTDAKAPLIYAKNYVLLDAENSEVLSSKNETEKIAIASTTKMVTALVARELISLDEVVTVGVKPTLVEGSKIQLKQNEKITVHDLLKGLLIQSGNDTAFALAEHYAKEPGNYQKFVGKMNEYIKAHNLTNTVFGDPAGLDDEIGRSTALELAHIARLLLNDPVLAQIVVTPSETVYSTNGAIAHELKNSNRLVVGDSPYYLPGVSGVKTGFTYAAGHCLVAAYDTPNGRLIGVVMNTAEYTTTASASEMRKLFTWSDSALESVKY